MIRSTALFGFYYSHQKLYKAMETPCRKLPAIVVPSTNPYSSSARASNPSASASTSMSFRYYQPPKSKRVESESDEESSEEERPRGSRRSFNTSSQQTKRGACTHCKGLKVKCHFVPGQGSCQRCISNKLQCVVVGRKKRRAVASHEELLLKSHKQDVEIANLLRQFDELTMDFRIKTWIDKASSKNSHSLNSPRSQHSMPSSSSSSMGREYTSWASSYGYAESDSPCSPNLKMSANYLPSPTSHPQLSPVEKFSVQELLSYFPDSTVTPYTKPPEIVARGIIHPHDVPDLFAIYFKFINPHCSVLEPVLHTPERLFWHSHFLFSLICCISTKYSPKHAPMVPVFVEFARDLAGKTLVGGRKTIDECQAYLIQSAYQLPRKRFEDQRTWLTMGLSFSLALELKLNVPPKDDELEEDSKDFLRWERELMLRKRMNRIRTWLSCYCIDASYATQFGKPAMLEVDDYIVQTCREWYLSPYSLPNDVHIVAHVEICRTMRLFRTEVEALEAEEKGRPLKRSRLPQVLKIVDKYHTELLHNHSEWSSRFDDHPRRDDYVFVYRSELNRMINAFNRLVVLSYGLQRIVSAKKHENGAGASRDDSLVRQCIETAKEVIKGMIYKLYPTGMLRYSLEAHFLFVTFAAAHLLSLLRPEMSILLRPIDVEDVDHLVRGLVRVLRSKEVSEDEHGHHAPFHYARYLTKQLKTFSTFLPRHDHNDDLTVLGNRESALGNFSHRSDAVSISNAASWTGPTPETIFQSTASSVNSGAEQQSFFHPDMNELNRTFADEQATELSGYPVDFSLINFLHTVNEPQYTKSTPPPGNSEDRAQWWQQMYPVNNQPSWPAAMSSPVGHPEYAHRFSPDS
ncbi:hypothetical protein ACEPAI_7046 [Sanghuangporus weigelae]